ncbi:RNI-like protein [Macrolepiota fuliginosa MF-IS2]|uniref:RNI-like protein n=1 Tax=Macrolepiota fuliginosa MF-IS2 TaxID=1400762 RepID=A0A9P6C0L7_9AGAR|nr:RNI-like protein [Macrolepiota fuliginosa MF-IS2]
MAASSSYCSPSSSAVTIPTPGKSILKRPPQQQQSLFSRFTKFLPTTQAHTDDETKPLKRAHFILPEIAIVYPISSINPPSTPALKDEKRAIEDREFERRRRVVRAPPTSPGAESDGWWNMDKVESFYRECCAGCDDDPDPAISAAFKNASHASPRTVDLSGVQLTITSAAVLSDVFTIEWGLRKVVFRECDLDEHTLKPILHSLLIPGTLSFLSVASNRRLKASAFRLIGAYIKKAKSLRFLDLAQNSLDKRAIEYVVAGLESPPEQGLESLRLDDCALRPAALEALCRAVRTSSLKHISLRHNRISSTGGVALALMIRDYPDTMPNPISISPTPSSSGTPASSTTSSPTTSVSSLPPITSPPGTPTTTQLPLPPPSNKTGPVLPPPRHPSQAPMQTTYTPYIPRNKRRGAAAPGPTSPLAVTAQQIPIITSSSQGGVTARYPVPAQAGSGHGRQEGSATAAGRHHNAGPSAALLDRVRALDALPRLGALRTLDLKGNDLRNGIAYLAQVLKRNRTLKLLNLSENKLDVLCLVAIAEALKYNSCLETLDMSKNPCSGPSLDGIQSLRTAFTLNTSLKRLFLSSTHVSSAGAIALAEFLPESTSLLHLDLTNNAIDLAGVMALNSGLKSNHVMRCLDLNIPPADEKFAKMCREILNTCIRNTEEAERSSRGGFAASTGSAPTSAISETPGATASQIVSGRGQKKGVWGLIEDSELARSIRKDEEKKIENSVITRARGCVNQLKAFIASSPSPSPAPSPLLGVPPAVTKRQRPAAQEMTAASEAVILELVAAIQETQDPERLEELLSVNDEINALLAQISSGGSGSSSVGSVDSGVVEGGGRPKLVLQGLGLSFDNDADTAIGISGNENGNDYATQLLDTGECENGTDVSDVSDVGAVGVDGGVVGSGIEGEERVEEEEEEEETPTTPRIDKGKGRAEPEQEEPEKVLSPSYVIDSEDEDENGIPEEIAALMPSPTERSRSWVEEEGEIFRKGNILLGPEELEGEYAGEELRKELLEAMVERPPPRPIHDEFGVDGFLGPGLDTLDPTPMNVPLSPPPPSVGTPTIHSPGFSNGFGLSSPTGEQQKPPPRPYIPRKTSSASIMSVISPSVGSPGPGLQSPASGGNGVGMATSPSPPVVGSASGGSPNALAHVPTFVKRVRSVDSGGTSSGSGSASG